MDAQNGSGVGGVGDNGDIRGQAIKRLRRKREFRRNFVTYLFVNAILWAIWALSGAEIHDTVPLADLDQRHLGRSPPTGRLEGLQRARDLRA